MHEMQQKILEISKTQDVTTIGLRPLGRLIGTEQPQLVKHHLEQLKKKGLVGSKTTIDIKKHLLHTSTLQPQFVTVPVVGAANCGPATIFAEENTEEYIKISKSLLHRDKNVFALVAKGNSMNKANIHGNNIEENDYVIIDGNDKTPNVGDRILSVIDNCANIKKFSKTADGNIALLSESTENYAPIYISESDQFIVNGKVIQVIKGVQEN